MAILTGDCIPNTYNYGCEEYSLNDNSFDVNYAIILDSTVNDGSDDEAIFTLNLIDVQSTNVINDLVLKVSFFAYPHIIHDFGNIQSGNTNEDYHNMLSLKNGINGKNGNYKAIGSLNRYSNGLLHNMMFNPTSTNGLDFNINHFKAYCTTDVKNKNIISPTSLEYLAPDINKDFGNGEVSTIPILFEIFADGKYYSNSVTVDLNPTFANVLFDATGNINYFSDDFANNPSDIKTWYDINENKISKTITIN